MNANNMRINSIISTCNRGWLGIRKAFTMKWASCIVAGCVFALSGNPAAAQILDDFDDNTINPFLWVAYGDGGPMTFAINQRVEMVIPSDSAGDVFCTKVQSNCQLGGDYDIQIDFELLQFPFQNGVRIGLGTEVQMGLVSFGNPLLDYAGSPRLNYAFGFPPVFSPTSDMAGKLRQVRTNGTVTGYYWDNVGEQWIEVSSAATTGADVEVHFSVWSHDYAFTDQEVRVAFDNFRVNSGTFVDCGHPASQVTVLDKLIAYEVATGGVTPEVQQSLHAKVDAALSALARGNPNNAIVAMNDLNALVNYVNAQRGNQITAEAAAAIIDGGNSIIASLGG